MEAIASTAVVTHRGDADLANLTENVPGTPVEKPPPLCHRVPPRIVRLRK